MSSQRSASMELSPSSDNNIRKRVCKACDRCRLKKSKCDGASPCSRCKADNAICVFGERKKSHDKVYPKGYVEMLEQQQAQLVAGLRELYSRLQQGQEWPGAALQEAQGGHPLTHDILERLGLLHATSDGSEGFEPFEDDCERMQQKLAKNGAAVVDRTRRRSSISSDSDHDHHSHVSPTSSSSADASPPTKSLRFNEPFVRHAAPPTPPSGSPFPPASQINMVKSQSLQPTLFQPSPLPRSVVDDSMANGNVVSPNTNFYDYQQYGAPIFGGNSLAFEQFNPMTMGPPVDPVFSINWDDGNSFDEFGSSLLPDPMRT